MLKKMWWLFLLVAVALVYWKWSDVKGLFHKGDTTPKGSDFSDTTIEDNEN